MSALNVCVSSDATHVLSDAAGYNLATGEQLCYVQKIAMLAHIPVVIAARGSLGFVPALAEWCNARYRDFDALVAGLVETAQSVAEVLAPAIGSAPLEIVAAGPGRAYLLRNSDWVLTPIEAAAVMPCDADLQARLGALGIDPTNPEHGLRLMREQRARTWTLGDSGISAVGGWCQIATVTRDGVSSRVLERWPDRLAEDQPSPRAVDFSSQIVQAAMSEAMESAGR